MEIVFNSRNDKFVNIGSICYTNKGGYVFMEGKQTYIPANTKLTINSFNVNKNVIDVTVNGKVPAEITYEFFIDNVRSVYVSNTAPVSGVKIITRTSGILSNEMLIKIVIFILCFITGMLVAKVF